MIPAFRVPVHVSISLVCGSDFMKSAWHPRETQLSSTDGGMLLYLRMIFCAES